MDQRQGQSFRRTAHSIPRVSKLPVARASRDNLKISAPVGTTAPETDPVKSSLPRPQGFTSKSIQRPLRENLNVCDQTTSASGSNLNHSARPRSPVRSVLPAATLETTPPCSRDFPVFDDGGDENSTQVPEKTENLQTGTVEQGERDRRPRPSLTERTIETLSKVSASPSNRRRSSFFNTDNTMGPPARPASSHRSSRPATPSIARPKSPNKPSFRPPRSPSPTQAQRLPAVPSPGSLYTPPRVFMQDGSSRAGRPPFSTARSVSNLVTQASERKPVPNYSSKTMRVKPTSYSREPASPQGNGRAKLDSIFRDPIKSVQQSNQHSSGNPSLLRPKTRGQNTIARSPAAGSRAHAATKPVQAAITVPDSPSTKSSAALRETIAKAKAAKRAASMASKSDLASPDTFTNDGDMIMQESNRALLTKRIQGATTSGNLNIAGMGLDQIPAEVMRIYEANSSGTSWAEMVDVVKFNVGDNKIEVIGDDIFPDWSAADVENDDEKSNQFGGIENLDLRNNLLQSLPVGLRRLERLGILNLNGNKLQNDVLAVLLQIPSLEELHLARNCFNGTVDLSNIVSEKLRILKLQENEIETVTLGEQMTSSLQNLNLSKNGLKGVPWKLLAQCPLIELNLSSNQLHGVAFDGVTTGFARLQQLDLSRNSLESVADFASNLFTLQALFLSSNRLQSLPDLGDWSNLVTLQVSENKLKEMPTGMCKLTNLKNVDMSQNEIKVLDPSISLLENLVTLGLAGNPLRDRKYLTMDADDLKADLQKRLEPEQAPDLDGAGKGDKPAAGSTKESSCLYKAMNGVLDLTSKNLTDVNLGEIDLEVEGQHIHSVRLSNNELTSFPMELLSHPALKWSLKSLDLSHNPRLHPTEYLTEEVFLPKLQSLYVVSTGLTDLDALTTYLKAPELVELNISCHRLAGHLPWIRAWYPNCTTLLATDNWFSTVDVEAVRGLEVLDIKNNEIESLPAGIGLLGNHAGLREAGRLRVFECSGNRFRVPRITVLEKGTEAVLKDLRRMVSEGQIPNDWRDEI